MPTSVISEKKFIFYSFHVTCKLNTTMHVQHQYKQYQLIMPQCPTFQKPFCIQKKQCFSSFWCVFLYSDLTNVALRPQKRGCLLGMGGGGGRESEGLTTDTTQKRLERPWTAARTMEVLRRCPLVIAQRLVHCATAVSTVVLGRVTRTMSVALLLRNNPK